MADNNEQALEIDVLMATLRQQGRETASLVEILAKMLEASLPDQTKIERGGWFMSKDRPVEKLFVRFDEFEYQIVRQGKASFSARQAKLVRGVILKTSDISMDQCIAEIIQSCTKSAESSAQTRDALNKFVHGK